MALPDVMGYMMKGRICVVVPVFNESILIQKTLQSLQIAGFEAQDVYVVDDKSTDNTVEYAKTTPMVGTAGIYLPNIHTVDQNGGKAAAQRAIMARFDLLGRYDWIIFMDGDTIVDPEFRTSLFSAATKNPTVALFTGHVVSIKENTAYTAYRAYAYAWGQEILKKGQSNFNCVYVSPGCASMFATDVLGQLTIDSDTLAEDMDLTLQVHKLGKKTMFVSEAKVYTQDPNSFKDYVKQVTRWTRGYWQIIKKHGIFSIGKKKPVDLYLMFATLEGILFNSISVYVLILVFFPPILWISIVFNFALYFLINCWAAYYYRRIDILKWVPVTYFMQFVNWFLFVRSGFEVVFLQNRFDWNKVRRYT